MRMEFCKKIKIGPVRVYVTTYPMRKRSPSEERWRNRHGFRLRAQAKLVKRQGCCCARCGIKLRMDGDGEIHHVIPVHERPDLAFDLGNLQLLCHDCHIQAHREWDAINDI